jgi:tripartite-type tricarboxylate transporter receptor subunit TctC
MSVWKPISILTIAVGALGIAQASAQDYPTGPVEFIVPFGAGGGLDIAQRMFNKYAEPVVGQALPISNRPGAGGVIGWAEAIRAPADGYTLMGITSPQNLLPALLAPADTGYTNDQFTHICVYANIPDVLLVPETSSFETLADLIAYAKENPARVTVANSGALGGDYMMTLMFEDAAGIELTKVPFNSGAETTQATLSGTTMAQVGSAVHAVAQQGTMRTLGIAANERSDMIPDVPTFREQGFEVISERYRALGGPPDLPEEIVSYWADVCEQVTSNPEFVEEMTNVGTPVEFKGSQETQEAMDQMVSAMERLIQAYDLGQ